MTSLSSCQMFEEHKPADVRDATIDAEINPQNKQDSVIETMPLLSGSVLELYNQAKELYGNNQFEEAIEMLQRANEIQQAPQVSQLLAEIYLHKKDYKQAHVWAEKSTEQGPSKGSHCEKSYRILAAAAKRLGYIRNYQDAVKKQEDCLVIAPETF
ncbi:MAG: hypothetical protein R3F25_01220 [Gammaproteobacteria bacterium]